MGIGLDRFNIQLTVIVIMTASMIRLLLIGVIRDRVMDTNDYCNYYIGFITQ